MTPEWIGALIALAGLVIGTGTGVLLSRRSRRAAPPAPDPCEHALQASRLALAAELHSSVAHEVSAVLLQSAGARALTVGTEPRISLALDEIMQTSAGSMRELVRQRDVLRRICSQDAGFSGTPGLAAVGALVAGTRRRGLSVVVRTRGRPGQLEPSIDHTAFLLVQWWLRQAERGDARRMVVVLAWTSSLLTLRARLDGGAGPAGPLPVALQDRVQLLGGTVEQDRPGEEPGVVVSLPAFSPASAPWRGISAQSLDKAH